MYDNYTVKELKELLRERGLPVSGLKKILIERLIEYDNKNPTNIVKTKDIYTGKKLYNLLDKYEPANLDKIKDMLINNVDPNYYNKSKLNEFTGEKYAMFTLFYKAIRIGDYDLLKLMIEKGVDLSVYRMEYIKQLIREFKNNYEYVKLILDNSNPITDKSINILFDVMFRYADKNFDINTLEYILLKYNNIKYNNLALKYAITYINIDAINYIINNITIDINDVYITDSGYKTVEIAKILYSFYKEGLANYIEILPKFINDENEEDFDFYKNILNDYKNNKKYDKLLYKGYLNAVRNMNLNIIQLIQSYNPIVIDTVNVETYNHLFGKSNKDDSLDISLSLDNIDNNKFIPRLELILNYYDYMSREEDIIKYINRYIKIINNVVEKINNFTITHVAYLEKIHYKHLLSDNLYDMIFILYKRCIKIDINNIKDTLLNITNTINKLKKLKNCISKEYLNVLQNIYNLLNNYIINE